jgi:hypothetical protein
MAAGGTGGSAASGPAVSPPPVAPPPATIPGRPPAIAGTCAGCGAPLPVGARFCQQCGTLVG